MPLYEYQCEKCGDVFEVMQKFTDEPLKIHEKCHGPVRRLVSAPAFQFKGSGWYITDYAKGGGSATADSKPETPSSNGKPAADAKPAKSESSSSSTTPSTPASDKK